MATTTPENIAADKPELAPSLDYRFASFGYQNWEIEGPPPIMVNPAASLHSKLAWCWGEVNQIEDLASTLCTHENEVLANLGNLLINRVTPLVAMLEHLGESTCKTTRRD